MSIDVSGWRVFVDGQLVHLTPTEFRLLVFLAKRAGNIVGREQLAREVWGDGSMSSSRTIDAYIRRLRNRFVGSDTPQFLHVRGRGYQLVAPP